jgi:ligand-binding sensor domain-containing protein/signal transduction histidine kinase
MFTSLSIKDLQYKIFLYLFLLLVIITRSQLDAQRIKFKHLTTEDGLSQSTIACILQDSKGFMWFGTQDGLNKFDGYHFTIYRYDPDNPGSISGNSVTTIFEDSEHNLWIGTEGGLSFFNRTDNIFINYSHDENNPNSISNNNVYIIFEDSKKNLWVGTNGGGLNLFDRASERFIRFNHDENNPKSLSSNDIYTIFEDSRNNLWIGSWHGDLNLFDKENNTFYHYYYKNKKLSDNIIRDITEDRDGNILIGTHGDGLYKMVLTKNGEYNFSRYIHNSKNINSLSGNAVFAVLEDSQGRLWIGTENEGLNLFNRENNKFVHYKTDVFDNKNISHNSIWSLFEDKTGNIWIGTFAGGINMIPRYGGYFNHYKLIPGKKGSLSNNAVTSFYEDSKNNFWVGTDGGGLNLFNREKESFIHYNTHNSNIRSDAILSIYEDSKGNLWIGTWGGGLNLFDRKNGKFIQYTKESHRLSENNIFSILEDKNGVLWVGVHWGGISYFDRTRNRFINYTPRNSALIDDRVRVIIEDIYGYLWVGSDLGLSVFDPKTKTFVTYCHDENNEKSISKGRVMSIIETDDSTLWIGTTGGLNKFNRKLQNFTSYQVKDGLPNDAIKGIREDDEGFLWLSTNRGLSRLNPKTKEFRNFDISDGLQANEFYQCSHYKSKSGELFFGGVNGFNVFHPKDLVHNPYIPPIIITDFRIFNKPVEIAKDSPLHTHISETDQITLSYKHSVISFEFTALNYISSDKNEYSYKLEGFDLEWNYIGSKRSATYTNLDPGDYVFRVKGSNNDRIWNEEGTSIKISITPPFWQTWWFRILLFITIIMTIFTIHKIRVRNIEAQRRDLEIKVKERTHQLSEKAEALEQAKKETDNILHNVEEGFFILNNEYHISSQYSSILESIFSQKTLAQLNLIDFLREKIKPGELENTKAYLDLLFQDNTIEESIEDLNPLVDIEFIFHKGDSKISKYLDFGFKRIKEKENKEIELIATVRDVTEQVLLAKQLKEEEARRERLLQLILGILNVEPEMLHEFSESAKRELEFIDSILNAPKIDDYEALLIKMYRATHLIKGNARLLNIDYFAQAAHKFEDMISEVQKKTRIDKKDLEPLRGKLFELQTGIEEMEKVIERLGKVLKHKKGKQRTDTRALFRSLENLINSFSSDLGKKIKFSYKNFKYSLIPEKYHLLVKEVLIQLVRNSISHGIESPEERKRLRKPAVGKIEIATFKKDDTIGFRLRDDGRGIQLEKLKEKALQSGKWNANEINKWDTQKVVDLIFTSGISTARYVGMVAGRGVGLEGVKHRIQEHHGEISVRFDQGKYCEFEICLPLAS